MEIGRTLFALGIALTVLGLALMAFGKVPLLGRLPGDIRIERGNFTFYFPLATCLLLSLLFSLLFRVFFRK